MSRPTSIAAAACLAALFAGTLTACGADATSDADSVRATVHRFHGHIVDGDGQRACRMLTERGRREFVAVNSGPDRAGDCASIAIAVGDMLSDAEKWALPRIIIRRVEIDGDRATVRNEDVVLPPALDTPGRTDGRSVLVRDGGQWMIEELG